MSLIRWFLGKLILFINALTLPKPIQRDDFNQNKLNKKTKNLSIYQFEACPFCVKELVIGGGKHKVPCLRIRKTNAKTEWLYESDDIISFLKKNIIDS